MFGDYSANNVIWSGKKISQADIVPFQRAPGMLLDHRHARAMQNRRDWTIKRAIDLGCLREIGNFSRAAVVSNRRQLMRAFDLLYPEKTLQERRINITSLWARHGRYVVDWIFDAIDLGSHDHHIVYL